MAWGSCIKYTNVWSEQNLNFTTSIKDTEINPQMVLESTKTEGIILRSNNEVNFATDC